MDIKKIITIDSTEVSGEIRKAFFAYLATCMTDKNAVKGIKNVLGKKLEGEDVSDILFLAGQVFNQSYKVK